MPKHVGAQADINNMLALRDSPFHKLWLPLLGREELYLLSDKHAASSALRDSFARRWFPYSPLRERSSNDPDIFEHLKNHNVLLVLDAASNPLTGMALHRLARVDWVVEWDMPLYGPAHLMRKSTGARILPEHVRGGRLTRFDLGVLTVMRNPWRPDRWLVGCAAVLGVGTPAMLRFLAEPATNPDLLAGLLGTDFAQLPVRIDIAADGLQRLHINGTTAAEPAQEGALPS